MVARKPVAEQLAIGQALMAQARKLGRWELAASETAVGREVVLR